MGGWLWFSKNYDDWWVNGRMIVIGWEIGRTAIVGRENESTISDRPLHSVWLVEENNKAEHYLRACAIEAKQPVAFFCTLCATCNNVILSACYPLHTMCQHYTEPWEVHSAAVAAAVVDFVDCVLWRLVDTGESTSRPCLGSEFGAYQGVVHMWSSVTEPLEPASSRLRLVGAWTLAAAAAAADIWTKATYFASCNDTRAVHRRLYV